MLLKLLFCILSAQAAILTTTQVESIFAVEKPIEPKSVGQVDLPKDFRLGLSIKPLQKSAEWTNILLITQKDKLLAGMWVPPSSTRIYFVFSDGDDFGGYQTQELPLEGYSTIVVNVVENLVQFRVNDKNVGLFVAAGRPSGLIDLFVSDTDLYAPAKAAVKDLTISPISTLQSSDLQMYNVSRSILPDYFGVVTVPGDFSISFNILPSATSQDWCSVLHLNGAGKDTFLPSLWFYPDSSNLFIMYSGSDGNNIAELISAALPLEKSTLVTIQAKGDIVQVRYDDVTVYFGYLSSRIRGPAKLYLSDPEFPAPKAKIDSFKIEELKKGLLSPDAIALLSQTRPLSKQYFGRVDLPADYSLSFEITPKSTSTSLTNVLWFMGVFGFNSERCH
jgi:hypothetical protein